MLDRKAYNAEYRAKHRERIRERDRLRDAVRRATPGYSDYQADKVLKCRYGISLEQKQQMYVEQKGLCKLCGEPLPSDFRKAQTDHSHETKQVRGLIHWSCNKLIGFVENNADLISSIYIYLGWTKENEHGIH